MNKTIIPIMTTACLHIAFATEIHVSTQGDDQNDGCAAKPLLTISAAARIAQPGDTVTVHEGVYRERVNPPRGGESDDKRITYQAAPGAMVEIKGSEVVTGWEKVEGDVWKVTLPKELFGDFNPFADEIRGDWFNGKGRKHHTGAVYLNGDWLTEAVSLDEVMMPDGGYPTWLLPPSASGYAMNFGWFETVERTLATEFTKVEGEIRNASNAEGGECLGWIADHNWASYEGIDFGDSTEEMRFRIATPSIGAKIEIRLNKPDGDLIGTAEVPATGDWQEWSTVSTDIQPTRGKQNIVLVFRTAPIDREVVAASLKARNLGPLWFAEVANDGTTTVWSQFPGVDPNEELVEVNVRQSVFYPDQPGRNYITVRGFTMRQAATNWAPPTAEQVGLVGTHWSKGWIIENNTISHSVCTGITLGKHGDEHDNTSADTATGYVETIKRAQAFEIPWTKEHIGSHLVRNNHISHCEQSGLVGSMGCAFSIIEDNHIHDINVRELFTGAEQAGIKLHAPIDTIIRRNHIHRVPAFGGGIWLDWMTQGTRVTRNLLHDNSKDLFLEVNHGPYLVDNNILLSATAVWDWSQGGAFAHNLFGGSIGIVVDGSRETPFHEPHSTTMKGLHNILGGDTRYYNNIFLRGGLNGYNQAKLPMIAAGNLYLGASQPLAGEKDPFTLPDFEGIATLKEENGVYTLAVTLPPDMRKSGAVPVTTELFGDFHITGLPFVNPDGSSVVVDTDYTGAGRDSGSPTPGPFENPKPGEQKIKVR